MAALTKEELMALFEATVDPDFARALLEQPDSGIEVIEASAEVMAQASRAVEQTSQAFFLRPWSGQTYPPASGARLARVVLNVSRAAPANEPIVIQTGLFRVEEEVADFGPEGAEIVGTGRRYQPLSTSVLIPGESLLELEFAAERPGAGYNLPLSESITRIIDAGGASGEEGTVVPGTANHRLLLAPVGETAPPTAVGQYVRFSSGANAGEVRRVVAYEAPDSNFPHNGVLVLAASMVLRYVSITGDFIPGEIATQATTDAALVVFAARDGYVVGDRAASPGFGVGAVVGVQSGASAFIDAVLSAPDLVAETATAGWDLLTWEAIGVSVSNPESPTGGATAVLDHIGGERKIGRSPGETDEPYRDRVYARPDAISPNALIRAMNRVLAPYGLTGCLHEVSDLDTFQGLFYDAPANGPESRRYAFDLDFELRPADRYKLPLDLAEFRGFFVAAVPPMSLGEFGAAFDQGFVNFFDSAPFLTFFDGYAATAAAVRIAVWNALDGAREAGVGFDLVEDRFGC